MFDRSARMAQRMTSSQVVAVVDDGTVGTDLAGEFAVAGFRVIRAPAQLATQAGGPRQRSVRSLEASPPPAQGNPRGGLGSDRVHHLVAGSAAEHGDGGRCSGGDVERQDRYPSRDRGQHRLNGSDCHRCHRPFGRGANHHRWRASYAARTRSRALNHLTGAAVICRAIEPLSIHSVV